MNVLTDTWINIYKSTSNQCSLDSLSQEYTDLLFINNQSIVSFIVNSSFLNQHFTLDHITKLSYLDTILMSSNSKFSSNTIQSLYLAFNEDLILQTSTFFLPFSSLLHSEYQDTFSTVLLVSPELSNLFNDYIYSYILPNSFMNTPSAVFDSYLSNWVYHTGLNTAYFIFFWFYVWMLVYFLLLNTMLKWSNPLNFWLVRFYYYVFSIVVFL
jgi:hypothetical protein